MGIDLKPVSVQNWYACTKLKVTEEQRNVFPAPVVYWIAESKFVDDFELRAVYWNTDLVGFIVFCNRPDEDGNYWIPALMIDEQYQGRGFGKSAMDKLIEHMSSMNCNKIMIGHRPDNLLAAQLYESLGFKKVSEEVIDGEIIRLLELT
ncbi:GNAT family N-acetyltransferase [Paenibacillus lemnae]|uniref:GNAT family N-acetyltransferase n=1 Tax=Paenibacillus lemnae TaxID=1330551 RepID=A0A848M234_PAELE|nr:GNAT family N-acetyltransferase [Paenibacillus lemnae]NMO94300.1 GNAT family N-acetyltransferase [Paenibacillus lemnae]